MLGWRRGQKEMKVLKKDWKLRARGSEVERGRRLGQRGRVPYYSRSTVALQEQQAPVATWLKVVHFAWCTVRKLFTEATCAPDFLAAGPQPRWTSLWPSTCWGQPKHRLASLHPSALEGWRG